jgi:hypothetical protein
VRICPSVASTVLSTGAGLVEVLVSESTIVLAPAQLEELANLIADRLRRDEAPADTRLRGGLVDVHELAALLSVSRSWVYAHAAELGAVRLGSGSKPRLRFDPDVARAAGDRLASGMSHGDSASAGGGSAPRPRPRSRRTPNGAPKPGSILGSRPRGGV